MFYDLLHSPDGIVSDVPGTVAALVDKVGLIEPKKSWYQTSTCHGYEALFARVHPSRVLAPSRLEVIADHPRREPGKDSDISACISAVSFDQGDRLTKTHATVLTSSVFDELREHLERLGVRHRVDPPSDDLAHERLWVGFAPDEGPKYLTGDDAGIRFEVIPTQCLELPEAVSGGSTEHLPQVSGASMTRVAARSYLVDDLTPVLDTLQARLGWPAERVEGQPGKRRAVMAVNYPRSARFELWEPGYDEEATSFYATWGAGTFSTRIAVADLGAKLEDLADRNVDWHWVRPESGGADTVRIDAGVVPGFVFDLVDEHDGG